MAKRKFENKVIAMLPIFSPQCHTRTITCYNNHKKEGARKETVPGRGDLTPSNLEQVAKNVEK